MGLYPCAVCIYPNEYTLIVTSGEVVEVIAGNMKNSLSKTEFADLAILSGLSYLNEVVPMFEVLETAYWKQYDIDLSLRCSEL